LKVGLSRNNQVTQKLVHRLVCEAFRGEAPDERSQVNHKNKNGDKTDNHADNLEWNTPRQNNQHALDHHLRKRVLTLEQVVEIRERYAKDERQVDLAETFGISQRQISMIVLGKSWTTAGGPIAKRKISQRNRLTNEQVVEMRERFHAGETLATLSEGFQIHEASAYRIVNGDTHPNAGGPVRNKTEWTQLTDAEVIEIRERAAQGVRQNALAREFKLTPTAVNRIVRGLSYQDLGGPRAD